MLLCLLVAAPILAGLCLSAITAALRDLRDRLWTPAQPQTGTSAAMRGRRYGSSAPHRGPRWKRRARQTPALAVWGLERTSACALPAELARRLIAHYRDPISSYSDLGELVLDPICGTGTTLVEAVHLGRTAIGVELEPRWAALAAANLTLARVKGVKTRISR